MDIKELRGLMEAYSEVYTPQEEVQEGIKKIYHKVAAKHHERQADKAFEKGDSEKFERHNTRSMVHRLDAGEKIKQVKNPEKFREYEKNLRTKKEEFEIEEVEQIDEISAGLAGKVVNARIAATGAASDRAYKHRNPEAMRAAETAAGKEGRARKLAAGVRKRRAANEEVDIFDIVLEFLQAEGYAETLEEAEWIMANELDSEDIEEILEAEGSYGQTPKARTAMGKLVIDRMRKPASEYSQRGEKTKKLKAAEKQTRRQDTLSRGLSGGKKSSRPWGPRGKMDADDRAEARAKAVEYGEGGTYGAGSVTKNPKKLRKQKAMGEHD
jgi:hypothetical protein